MQFTEDLIEVKGRTGNEYLKFDPGHDEVTKSRLVRYKPSWFMRNALKFANFFCYYCKKKKKNFLHY